MGILFKSRVVRYVRERGMEMGISALRVSSRFVSKLEALLEDLVRKYSLDDLKKILKDED